ncbi:alpha/beta fold hydrolase [Cryomorphaceae bacterium 1068]|nr:alpha/beta fold hydrolase [Cryomorphaceae bacterium 1068]
MKERYSSELIQHPKGYQTCIHRFTPNEGCGIPVLLIHGSIENSRIFYSASGKGFAPFLAQKGFDVFVPDLPGKGKSTPKAARGFEHSQQQFIDGDFNDYIRYIRSFYPTKKIRVGGHSWGGVLALAWYAKFGTTETIGPMVFFGSKRKLATRSLSRLFMIDIMWSAVGNLSTSMMGYLPAVKLKMGSDNEPAHFYRETAKWVRSAKWCDFQTGEDMAAKLQCKTLPPALFFAGINDKVLGNPQDVRRLMAETGGDSTEFILLSKKNGNHKDYDHIDMLTARTCPEDHFPMAAEWLTAGNLK